MCGKDPSGEILEIARFTRLCEGYMFAREGIDFGNKKPILSLDIGIALRMS